ncbi:endoplasmic reticulum membrane adapter protein XK-like [Poeciliopsis prolifica]|uniref:endoplasmic reticulum membrane adapter protein XK-like n=1 Tax=Poeciliopsis prolifica TaxID=188132 RepID=UPI002413A5FE|nr:endoplasmic reticulum membrane adapter protein XK-like [Poeciliopsis prolifica]XP_054887242.1 endoplasmic reticulum membrane adapter protein XK-like [Poeciliopsis prolifica]
MCEVAMEEQGSEITDMERCSSREEYGVMVESARRRLNPPLSVVWTTMLYCAEFITACILCKSYHKSNDVIWMSFTITFMLVPAVLIQLTLTFIHRDVGRDRPLVLLLHLLQLGPVIRCFEALVVYFKAGHNEEPYVTLSRKTNLQKGREIELEIGQTERTLATHRNAFKRTAVIQAFLGSTPQLTLQLYATIQEKYILSDRLALMIITFISITYGALVCSVLAIQITYDSIKVQLRPAAYLCMVVWRALEITTRVTTLVLFSTALTHWVILVGGCNLLFFFFLPWVEFWLRKGSLAEGVEKNFSKLGTTIVLCMFTLLYACINVFCWSAVELDLADQELIDRKQSWRRLALYYSGRFLENFVLITLWYFFKSDFYEYVCAPLVVVQLLIGYSLAVLFMLLFYQFCHPCRSLFKYNVHDCLHCVCCRRRRAASRRGSVPPSYSTAATMLKEELLDPQNCLPPDGAGPLGERESLA